mmetsp:Transcript_33351/g.76980  ORF Transcript_33351/g.76980 Transcript_33351/m.76980 type:complete len:92 (+) Transcript_33351:1-276(+)
MAYFVLYRHTVSTQVNSTESFTKYKPKLDDTNDYCIPYTLSRIVTHSIWHNHILSPVAMGHENKREVDIQDKLLLCYCRQRDRMINGLHGS